ncbi:Cytochrome c heme lyase subunit CcmH [uncultured Candidatus Thioglobus sp.]|nr:Cytochrome c heme lyase subunit CcmH [uncultured Candidatus Thioglobus sp.]
MNELYLWFILMLIASTAWFLWFMMRPLKSSQFDLEKSNIALGKQKQKELEQDIERGLIDETAIAQAKEEIVQTLAVEIEQTKNSNDTAKQGISIGLASAIVVILVLASLSIYQALAPEYKAQNQAGPTLTLAQSVVKLNKHLEQKPKDFDGWHTLAIALFELNKIDESLKAYERSYQINPKNAAMLIEYASTLAIAQDNQFSGRVSTLVREALEINRNAPDALYLAGWVAINAQQLELAQQLWEKAYSLLPEGRADRDTLQRMLIELVKTQQEGAPTQSETPLQHTVKISVELSEQLRQQKYQNHYLMIYVKAAKGRPMPIAIQKIRLKDFTGSVILTDANSIIPSNKLSQASTVIAVARLSKTGAAFRQVDDIQASSKVVNVADNPTINLQIGKKK